MYLNQELIPVAADGDDHQRRADRPREGGRHHHPVLSLRSRTTRCPSCSRPCGASATTPASAATGSAASRPLTISKQFHPKYASKEDLAKKLAELKFETLGDIVQEPERRVPQSGPSGRDAVEDGLTDHHADVDPGAQSLQRVGRHGRQPASLHRPHPHDARRESGSHQPARRRRRVRLAGPAHRHRQAPGAAREPAEGPLPRAPRSFRSRRGRRAVLQPELRQGSRDRQVARHARVPHRALPRHRPPADQRDLRARSRPDRLGRARRADAVLPGPGVQDAAHGLRRQEAPTRCSTSSGSPGRTTRATACAPTAEAGCGSPSPPTSGFLPFTQIAEMLVEQWKKIGIRGEVQEMERGLATARVQANEHQIYFETQWGADNMHGHFPLIFPANGINPLGPLYGVWYASAGAKGKTPPPAHARADGRSTASRSASRTPSASGWPRRSGRSRSTSCG